MSGLDSLTRPKHCHLERNTVSGKADDCVESKDPCTIPSGNTAAMSSLRNADVLGTQKLHVGSRRETGLATFREMTC